MRGEASSPLPGKGRFARITDRQHSHPELAAWHSTLAGPFRHRHCYLSFPHLLIFCFNLAETSSVEGLTKPRRAYLHAPRALSQLRLPLPVDERRPQCPARRSPARPAASFRWSVHLVFGLLFSCRLLVSQCYCLFQKTPPFLDVPKVDSFGFIIFAAGGQASPALGAACWSFWRLRGPQGSLTPNPSLLYFIYLGGGQDLFLTYVLERRRELGSQHRRPREVICSSRQPSYIRSVTRGPS